MIGVCFLGQTVKFVIQTTEAEQSTIQTIGEQPFTHSQAPEQIGGDFFSSEVLNIFQYLQGVNDVKEFGVGVVLPSKWMHMYTIPIDTELSVEDAEEFARWTFKQRFGEHAEKYEPRFYSLESNETHRNVLTVVFPAKLIQILHQSAEKSGLDLRVVAIDLFVGWSAVPFAEKPEYLCKFSDDIIQLSQSIEDELIGTALFQRQERDTLQFLRGTVRTEIANEWKQMLHRLLAGEALVTQPIWFYGNSIPTAIQENISSLDTWAYVTPFSFFFPEPLPAPVHNELEESQYTEAIGVLRQMTRTAT